MPIPKIIIQTWKSKDLPDYYKKTQENIIRIHPDYEYKYFDDEGIDVFINTNYPQLKSTVKKFKRKIQLIDFFRLLAVHKYGGFYFDMDVEVVKKLDDLLSYECVFPAEMLRNSQILKNMGYDYNLGNYAFGASKNNNVIWNIITSIVNVMENPNLMSTDLKDISDSVLSDFNNNHNNHNNHNNSNNSDSNTKHNEHLMQEYVYHTTGPVMVSKSVFESMGSNMSVKILYPKDWPIRSSWFFFGDYAKHTMTGTWKDNETGNNNTNNSNNTNNNQNNKDISEKKDNIEKFTANDIYEDPSSYLIICTVIMIIVVLFILISIAIIGCDKDIKIIRL